MQVYFWRCSPIVIPQSCIYMLILVAPSHFDSWCCLWAHSWWSNHPQTASLMILRFKLFLYDLTPPDNRRQLYYIILYYIILYYINFIDKYIPVPSNTMLRLSYFRSMITYIPYTRTFVTRLRLRCWKGVTFNQSDQAYIHPITTTLHLKVEAGARSAWVE